VDGVSSPLIPVLIYEDIEAAHGYSRCP
jgi:hypothetical protein